MSENSQTLRFEIERLKEEIKGLNEQLLTEPNTGLPNKVAFYNKIKELQSDLDRGNFKPGVSYCIVFADFNSFKQINDKFDHLTADELVRMFADSVKDKFRPNDTLFRVGGGDEFALVATINSDSRNVEQFAHKVENIYETAFLEILVDNKMFLGWEETGLGISVGWEVAKLGDDPMNVYRRADKNMQKNKEAKKKNEEQAKKKSTRRK